jgi:hypothetical protein
MINPQAFGVSPEALAQAQKFGEYMGARVVLRRRDHEFTIRLVPRKPEAELAAVGLDLGQVVGQLVEGLCTQFYACFGIESKVQDVE